MKLRRKYNNLEGKCNCLEKNIAASVEEKATAYLKDHVSEQNESASEDDASDSEQRATIPEENASIAETSDMTGIDDVNEVRNSETTEWYKSM